MSEWDPCTDDGILSVTTTIHCKGHPNITGTHRSTLEITKDPLVSKAGTCIIGVSSDKGSKNLPDEFRKILSDNRSELTSIFEVNGLSFTIKSSGSEGITLEHENDIVWRRSGFLCGRTIGIFSSLTAEMIPRDIIKKIQSGAEIKITLTARLDPEAQPPSVPHLPGIFHTFEESPCHADKE